MTIQQQACNRILKMSDEGAAFINQVINNMNPAFFDNNSDVTVDITKRIGIGKEIIEDPEDFDKWDDEIADLFEGVEK